MPFFRWGVDSQAEDERREVALSIAKPFNLKEILAVRPNVKRIRLTNLITFEYSKEPIRSVMSPCKDCEPKNKFVEEVRSSHANNIFLWPQIR